MSVLLANIVKVFPLLKASSIVTSRAVHIETVTESENHNRERHITSTCVGEIRFPSDMWTGKHNPWGKTYHCDSATGFCVRSPAFILYVNYLPNKIKSFLRLYADDVILYGEIHIEQDVIRLQKDLDTITWWAETWLMKLNKVWILYHHKSEKPHKFKLLSLPL